MTGIAYETIRRADGTLPLLTPMSEVAGRMGVQVGAQYLERPNGGRGILLGGVPGVAPANVAILGGGVVGTNAAKVALGMGAHVTIIDRNLNRLRELDDIFNGMVVTLASNTWTIARDAEALPISSSARVLIPGASAPKLVRREMISQMKRGSVVVDVAIDQGGCFETSHATTHTDPVYFVDNVLHYCVSNMPAAVPHTSTFALTNATFPYLLELANKGLERACAEHPGSRAGVNTYRGDITYRGVAESQGRPGANSSPAGRRTACRHPQPSSKRHAADRNSVERASSAIPSGALPANRSRRSCAKWTNAPRFDKDLIRANLRAGPHGHRDPRRVRRPGRQLLSVRPGHRGAFRRRSLGRRRRRRAEHDRQQRHPALGQRRAEDAVTCRGWPQIR